MPSTTAGQLYELARQLSSHERLRLVALIAHDLAATGLQPEEERPAWMDIEGAASDILQEDAQQWISRHRQEGDARRDEALGRRP